MLNFLAWSEPSLVVVALVAGVMVVAFDMVRRFKARK